MVNIGDRVTSLWYYSALLSFLAVFSYDLDCSWDFEFFQSFVVVVVVIIIIIIITFVVAVVAVAVEDNNTTEIILFCWKEKL